MGLSPVCSITTNGTALGDPRFERRAGSPLPVQTWTISIDGNPQGDRGGRSASSAVREAAGERRAVQRPTCAAPATPHVARHERRTHSMRLGSPCVMRLELGGAAGLLICGPRASSATRLARAREPNATICSLFTTSCARAQLEPIVGRLSRGTDAGQQERDGLTAAQPPELVSSLMAELQGPLRRISDHGCARAVRGAAEDIVARWRPGTSPAGGMQRAWQAMAQGPARGSPPWRPRATCTKPGRAQNGPIAPGPKRIPRHWLELAWLEIDAGRHAEGHRDRPPGRDSSPRSLRAVESFVLESLARAGGRVRARD
jgi:hypothetical protein